MNLQTFQESSHKFVGLPYSKYDCWGLCKKFYTDIFGKEMLAWFDYDNIAFEVGSKEWSVRSNYFISQVQNFFIKTNSPQFGDIILIKLWNIPSHVGIYIDSNHMLHTNDKNGSHIDKISRWEKMIEGYYRYAPV